MKRFAMIGAAGYIAPRHMQAISATNNELVAALDPQDSVGVIDNYFPEASFFVEFERFDRHLDLLRRDGNPIDCVSICSPNYLHDSHIRFALRSGADAICEKPLVLNPWNLDPLVELEAETGRKIRTILQLRLHPSILALKEQVNAEKSGKKFDVDLCYITSRGRWYHISWKGQSSKSGGIATNIGVHFFDMLGFVFGSVQHHELHASDEQTMAGFTEYEAARVRWILSVDANLLPANCIASNQRTYRSIKVGDMELEFSGGFTDLHTESYKAILRGDGYGVEDTRAAVETVAALRDMQPSVTGREHHPLLKIQRAQRRVS